MLLIRKKTTRNCRLDEPHTLLLKVRLLVPCYLSHISVIMKALLLNDQLIRPTTHLTKCMSLNSYVHLMVNLLDPTSAKQNILV
jgi:hypothetical protein